MIEKPGFAKRLVFALRVLTNSDVSNDYKRLANTKADLKECEERVERLQKEYALERERSDHAAGNAAEKEFADFVRKTASSLVNLDTMKARAARGEEVRVQDMIKVADTFVRLLQERGLEPIATVDDEVPFDTSQHQRMSGSAPTEGDPVRVRFVGYRFHGKIIAKAMVTQKEGGDGASQNISTIKRLKNGPCI